MLQSVDDFVEGYKLVTSRIELGYFWFRKGFGVERDRCFIQKLTNP